MNLLNKFPKSQQIYASYSTYRKNLYMTLRDVVLINIQNEGMFLSLLFGFFMKDSVS